MRKTTKKFLIQKRFEKSTLFYYTDVDGEPSEHTFYICGENNRQFLRADLDSWHYFQNRLAESMKNYQVILLDLVDILKEEYIDGGWDQDATSVTRDYCLDMEREWHNVECYQMILEELKKKL